MEIPRPFLLLCVVLCLNALPALADWASAESPDFTVDTTVPEPCLFMMAVCGVFLLARNGRIKALMILMMLSCFAMTAMQTHAAAPVVTNVTAVQAAPMDPVDIYYDLVDADGDNCDVSMLVSTNSGTQYGFHAVNVRGDIGIGMSTGNHKHIVWDVLADAGPDFVCDTMRVRITADDRPYMVVDVSDGQDATNYPVTYLASQPALSDEYRTSKIVLRRIPAGSFVMGSPTNEMGREDGETQHNVTLTKAFYIGIYEITQAQYSNVMGINPSYFKQGAHAPKRPVERISWAAIRGGTWPAGNPAASTFVGKLRAKAGVDFDLPTEAQWECACRAGTTNALNNNTNLQSTEQDTNMGLLGRYYHNGGSAYSGDPVNGAHTTVGSYLVNNWGLYDMHGNVWEWCLDWRGSYSGDGTDPSGPASGYQRVMRGGSYWNQAWFCRSGYRSSSDTGFTAKTIGFRLALPADQ